eukprot:m.14346 g.14346  ORF g.14346 m.14346 type:complete len:100 (-) comp10416_c0_seq1:153-452(-)
MHSMDLARKLGSEPHKVTTTQVLSAVVQQLSHFEQRSASSTPESRSRSSSITSSDGECDVSLILEDPFGKISLQRCNAVRRASNLKAPHNTATAPSPVS